MSYMKFLITSTVYLMSICKLCATHLSMINLYISVHLYITTTHPPISTHQEPVAKDSAQAQLRTQNCMIPGAMGGESAPGRAVSPEWRCLEHACLVQDRNAEDQEREGTSRSPWHLSAREK